jgi:predicted methyltransferase
MIAAFGALGVTAAAVAASAGAIPAAVTAAVNDPSRPDTDRQRDALRKPAEVIAFAGIKPGERIGELMPGRGYFTNIFCKLVGDKGHVYTVNITPQRMGGPSAPDVPAPAPAGGGAGMGNMGNMGATGGGAMSAPPAPRPPAPLPGAACENVTRDSTTAAGFHLPDNLDVVWTSENYHDLHNAMFGSPDMKALDKMVFDALKPGGLYIVEDHMAEKGSGSRDTNTLHRIDPELVKQEVTSAGFRLVGESSVLHVDEPHTAKVFELHGSSDKFLLKFQKPKG